MARHTAMIPLMNSGTGDLDDFTFKSGARITNGFPQVIQEALDNLRTTDQFSQNEIKHWDFARGWLWITSNNNPGDTHDTIRFLAQMARQLWTLRWCIDIAGCGENNFWRNGSLMHCAGVYVSSPDFPLPSTQRHHFIYSPPTYEQRMASWSAARLAIADDLHQRLPVTVPRIAIATKLRYVMSTRDARDATIRFSLALTALETLFIAPSERHYIWDPPVQDRIREANRATAAQLDASFFEKVRDRRNDATHRGGFDQTGIHPRLLRVEPKTEDLLRDSLGWAIRNQRVLESAFETDQWPADAGE